MSGYAVAYRKAGPQAGAAYRGGAVSLGYTTADIESLRSEGVV